MKRRTLNARFRRIAAYPGIAYLIKYDPVYVAKGEQRLHFTKGEIRYLIDKYRGLTKMLGITMVMPDPANSDPDILNLVRIENIGSKKHVRITKFLNCTIVAVNSDFGCEPTVKSVTFSANPISSDAINEKASELSKMIEVWKNGVTL